MIAHSAMYFFVLYPWSGAALRLSTNQVYGFSHSNDSHPVEFPENELEDPFEMEEELSRTASVQDGWHSQPVAGSKSYASVHIPKTAGSSFAVDAEEHRVIPEGVGFYSAEHCPSEIQREMQRNENVTSLPEMMTFLRNPRAHVYSQYLELNDDEKWKWEGKKKFAKQFPTFESYLDYFVDEAGAEKPAASSRLPSRYYTAYHPKDMQARSFICKDELHDFAEIDLNMALEKMESYIFIGLTEFYQESFCLFHGKIRKDEELPAFCNCKDTTEWSKFGATRITHNVRRHSLNDLKADTIMKIDALTKQDAALYNHGKTRFLKDIKELEQKRGITILCDGKNDDSFYSLLHPL